MPFLLRGNLGGRGLGSEGGGRGVKVTSSHVEGEDPVVGRKVQGQPEGGETSADRRQWKPSSA